MADTTSISFAPRRTLLEWFLGSLPDDVPNSRLASALRQRDAESWADWLMRAAGILGWRAERIEASPEAVEGERDSWWVTCVRQERERWLVLAGARSEGTQASLIDGQIARDISTRPGDLCDALHLDEATDEVSWIRLTPELPLESLRSEGETLSPFARLGRWTRLERRTVLAVVAYSAVIGAISLVLPLAVQSLVNILAFGQVLQPLMVISVGLLLVLLLAAGLRVLEVYIIELLQRRAFTDLARDVARRLPAAAPDSGGRWGLTERINRFFDIVGAQKASASLLLSATEVLMSSFAGLLILAFYHPYLLVYDLVLLAAIAFVIFRLGRGGIETAVEESHAKYEVAAWLEAIARQQRRFLSPEGVDWSARRTDRLTVDWLQRRATHFRVVLRQTIGFAGIHAIASATLLGLGSFLVWNGQLTLGQLVASELIITGVLAQIAKFGKHLESFYDLNASVEKLGYLVDLDTEVAVGDLLPDRPEGIRLRVEGLPIAGRAESFFVEPGERVGIARLPHRARDGLFELLYARREAEGGAVYFDDARLSALAPRALRRQVALVREAKPVGATLEENLTSGDAQSSPEELRELLHRVGLGELMSELPDGLQTWIYPNGDPLSHSQLTALEVARALRLKPRLILIDGALDHVSQPCFETLWEELTDSRARWSLLIASERHEVVSRCERRYVWAEDGLREEAS